MSRQAGWTVWSVLGVAILLALFAMLFMKLFPPYFDNLKLQEALETVAEDPRVTSMNRRALISELDDLLYIDYGHEVVNLRESLSVEKNKTSMIMSIQYEVIVPIAYNVSALMDFSNRVEVPLR